MALHEEPMRPSWGDRARKRKLNKGSRPMFFEPDLVLNPMSRSSRDVIVNSMSFPSWSGAPQSASVVPAKAASAVPVKAAATAAAAAAPDASASAHAQTAGASGGGRATSGGGTAGAGVEAVRATKDIGTEPRPPASFDHSRTVPQQPPFTIRRANSKLDLMQILQVARACGLESYSESNVTTWFKEDPALFLVAESLPPPPEVATVVVACAPPDQTTRAESKADYDDLLQSVPTAGDSKRAPPPPPPSLAASVGGGKLAEPVVAKTTTPSSTSTASGVVSDSKADKSCLDDTKGLMTERPAAASGAVSDSKADNKTNGPETGDDDDAKGAQGLAEQQRQQAPATNINRIVGFVMATTNAVMNNQFLQGKTWMHKLDEPVGAAAKRKGADGHGGGGGATKSKEPQQWKKRSLFGTRAAAAAAGDSKSRQEQSTQAQTRIQFDSVFVLALAVLPSVRKGGIGTALMHALHQAVMDNCFGVNRITLLVRQLEEEHKHVDAAGSCCASRAPAGTPQRSKTMLALDQEYEQAVRAAHAFFRKLDYRVKAPHHGVRQAYYPDGSDAVEYELLLSQIFIRDRLGLILEAFDHKVKREHYASQLVST